MVKCGLQLKATLENIEEFEGSGREFAWCFKFTCSNCGEVSPKWNDVSLSEEVEQAHGKAVSHFVSKCKMCSRTNTMTIIEDSVRAYTAKDEGNFKTVVVLDCRGLEPTSFWAKAGWTAKASDDGDTFEDVDLTEGDWADYCETTKRPVSISDVGYKFVKIK